MQDTLLPPGAFCGLGYAVLAVPRIAKPVEHFSQCLTEAMIENDFEWAVNNRAQLLEEWTKR